MGSRDGDWRQLLEDDPSSLLRLVDRDFLRGLMNDFTVATGLHANIVNVSGVSIFSKRDARNNCEFCKIVRALDREAGLRRCVDAYEREGRAAVEAGEAVVFRCPAGLFEWIMPIMLEGVHIGSIICGQVLMHEPDEGLRRELAEFNRDVTEDSERLFQAAQSLDVVSPAKVEAASHLMGILANSIMRSVFEELRRESDAAYQKRLLDEERDTREELERQLDVYSTSYYLDQVQMLSDAASKRDFDKARSILTVIIADDVNGSDDLNYVQTRLYDLVFMVSHAAIDGGVDPEQCMSIMTEYSDAARFTSSLEGMGHLAEDTGRQLLKAMEESASARRPAVDSMCSYIKGHLDESFALKDVADAVELSPYYASRIFKDDMGMTIMDYATMARMNEAKYMLTDPTLHIEDVAGRLGYADPSYFGRVFKKTVGMSPRQYRAEHGASVAGTA